MLLIAGALPAWSAQGGAGAPDVQTVVAGSDPANDQVPPNIIRGTGVLSSIPAPEAPRQPVSGEGFQMNFSDMEIAAVVAAVLGDGLGMPYLVDPKVKGTMSLQATRPLGREETLAALEAALRVEGFAMVERAGVMHIVPLKEAPRQISGLRAPGQGGTGFGIYVVPLQYVSAADMERILQPFAPEGEVIRVDSARNLLLLAGTGQDVTTLMGVVNTFDVDWLAGMSFGIYPLNYVDAKTLSTELGEVFSDTRSPIAGVVRIVPLARLNSLLVVTPQVKYLSSVETWIKRLDVAGTTPGRRIYVYDVQNSKADDLARSLSSILSIRYEAPVTPSAGGPIGSLANADNPGTGASGSFTSGYGSTASQSVRPSYSAAAPGTGSTDSSSSGLDAGSLKIVPNSENNSLLILASPSEYSVIEAALKRLDIVPIQVLIEASIAEVTLTDDMQFGINWSVLTSKGPVNFNNGSTGTPSQSFPGLSFLYNAKTNISAVLNTLESYTKVRVLSSPKLLVLNNREAELQVGDEVPIVTQSAVSTAGSAAPIVNSVQMQATGVILHVTPRANKGGRIMLDISQEVSDVTATTTSTINSPTIEERKIASTVSVASGETIALGGLIQDQRTNGSTGIPLLSRIPLIGGLFGANSMSHQRTELIVLITPRIIRSDDESDTLMHELRSEFEALKPMTAVKGVPLNGAHPPEP